MRFFLSYMQRRLVLRLIVLLTADLPEVGVHGLLAVGEVLLREEVDLVLGDFSQIFLTRSDHRTYGLESLADSHLFLLQRRGTGDGMQVAEVDARAVG